MPEDVLERPQGGGIVKLFLSILVGFVGGAVLHGLTSPQGGWFLGLLQGIAICVINTTSEDGR